MLVDQKLVAALEQVQERDRAAGAARGRWHFVEPTVVTGVRPYSTLATTEIFGPVAAIQIFADTREAVAAANATEWGLVGYVITQDIY